MMDNAGAGNPRLHGAWVLVLAQAAEPGALPTAQVDRVAQPTG